MPRNIAKISLEYRRASCANRELIDIHIYPVSIHWLFHLSGIRTQSYFHRLCSWAAKNIALMISHPSELTLGVVQAEANISKPACLHLKERGQNT
ncbi:hypothetical protein AVEN_258138-1 [Araneus ventricosus]|uniref:Uncharacterized protein n=1 Tax=Araneus ventricosus TaxID=182803 RepID=A0A4Y2IUI2_ARAVE|nr:hypothetical protein AVEN_258138-1 [Araneus ventricosus]